MKKNTSTKTMIVFLSSEQNKLLLVKFISNEQKLFSQCHYNIFVLLTGGTFIQKVCSPRMRKVVCSNPSHERPKS